MKKAVLLMILLLPVLLAAQVGITYSLGNGGFSLEEGALAYSFDILARASHTGTGIGTGTILLAYNEPAFGSWIHGEGNVTLIPGTLTTHPFYNYGLLLNDTHANVLAITFEYEGVGGYGNPLPVSPTQLLRVQMKVQDPAQNLQINFWPAMDDPLWQIFMDGQQYYDDNATLYDPVAVEGEGLADLFVPSLQTIPLQTGWNLVSSWILPLDADLGAVFADIISAGKLVKIQDERGQAYIQDVGGTWVNSIGDFLVEEGYYVQMNAGCDLVVSGFEVALPMSVDLQTGWNILPYPHASSQAAMPVLQPLIDAGDLVKVQDEQGNSIVQDVDGSWNDDIGIFSSGEAYHINVSAGCQITFQPLPAKRQVGKK